MINLGEGKCCGDYCNCLKGGGDGEKGGYFRGLRRKLLLLGSCGIRI